MSNAFLVKLKHIKNAFLVKLKHIKSNAFHQVFPFGGCWGPEKDQVVFNDSDDVYNWELEQGWSRPSEVVMVFCFC